MNYKLLSEHIDSNVQFVPKKLESDGSNAFDFYSSDVVGNKRFAQNFGGYPRSEIAEINDQMTLQAQKNLLEQLEDYSSLNKPAGLSDVELSLGHKSKYMQTPSEMQSWLMEQIAIRDARRAAAVRADESKVKTPQSDVKSSVVSAEPE